MPSKNMLPKGQRRRTVRPQYVATRGVEAPEPEPIPQLELEDDALTDDAVRVLTVPAAAAGLRLDQYLTQAIPEISRARVQLLIDSGQVLVHGQTAKPKRKLAGGEQVEIHGAPHPEPLHATPEEIPLRIVYEDTYLAVIDKPAGMTVHAGAGASDDERNRGTLVNALLFHFQQLSGVGGDLRPGIVHRLDKQTSGLILVAKDDVTHRKLGEMFAARALEKTYLALVHGHVPKDDTTITLPVARDLLRRTRMTTRRGPDVPGARSAISHVHVLERLQSRYGAFSLVEVHIETGRTHQIRVHLQALGHPVVGDTLYGAPHQLHAPDAPELALERNFLHAAHLVLRHPRTGSTLDLTAPLPVELESLLAALRVGAALDSVKSTL
ncbi:MAG: RluA family pseudouridine synthase [Acidobacteriota bacterium]|nr:RluA family pseudouridine synthase [Acidobacteriota bacterium]